MRSKSKVITIMKRLLRNKFKQGFGLVFRPLGFMVVDYNTNTLPALQRAKILKYKKIDYVLDVGANIGQYAHELRQYGYNGKITSFEPVPEAFHLLSQKAIADPLWTCRQVALGSETGIQELNVYESLVMSSFLQPGRYIEEKGLAVLQNRTAVSIYRLDDLVSELSLDKHRILAKLDVQGYELEILKGAKAVLSHIDMLEIELSFIPVYHGQPTLCDIVGFLAEQGFVQVSAHTIYQDTETAYDLQIDSIFVRA